MSKYTEEELALLSPEEREAIAEDTSAPSGDDTGGDTGDGDATKIVDDGVAGDETPAVAVEDTEPEAFAHQYQSPAVENFDERMAEFTTQKTELRQKFKDGDLDIDAYEEAKDALLAQESVLREQKIKADISAEQIEQSGKARWEWEQDRFFKDPVNAMYKDKYTLAAFDAAVRDLGGDPKNSSWDGAKFLEEADKLIRSRFNVPSAPKTDTPPANRKPDLSVVPKTLGNLPAADIPETGAVDEFAHIDRLSGLDYERAVAKLSEAERERFRRTA